MEQRGREECQTMQKGEAPIPGPVHDSSTSGQEGGDTSDLVLRSHTETEKLLAIRAAIPRPETLLQQKTIHMPLEQVQELVTKNPSSNSQGGRNPQTPGLTKE